MEVVILVGLKKHLIEYFENLLCASHRTLFFFFTLKNYKLLLVSLCMVGGNHQYTNTSRKKIGVHLMVFN